MDGDGSLDFNDSNKDGCPDLNIKWQVTTEDNQTKWITINGDRNHDGIPELNVDVDGDGIPELNIDTDEDGLPDVNLVVLTKSDWKSPTICSVDTPEKYCTGTSAKAILNVDIDTDTTKAIQDRIPTINIDTDGDRIPDVNLSDDGKHPVRNLVRIHKWLPETNFTKDGFSYDTMVLKPATNIDSDKDGRPDINLDFNGDGVPELNIDIDGNWIPDMNIDSTGDGKPNINIDRIGNGIPKENVMALKEWKPDKDVDGSMKYDTMEIKSSQTIEDGGIIIEKPDDEKFLPNTSIKVKEISDTVDEVTKADIEKIAGKQSVIKVFDVQYVVDGKVAQPDGSVYVKIPVSASIKNPRIVIEKEDRTFALIDAKEENGYYIVQTDYIGKVSIIGDLEEERNPDVTNDSEDQMSVKGTYIDESQSNTDGIGGAYTGDETNRFLCIGGMIISVLLCFKAGKKVRR